MDVSASELSGYSSELEAQQEAAAAYVEASLEAYRALNPDATVADIREFGIQVLSEAYRIYGDRAAAVAAQRYDETARALGYDLDAASISNAVDADAVERDVRYLARYAGTDWTRFTSLMAAKAYDHALRAANGTVYDNANREADRAAGMRYARVPTGRETCGFCLMLASLGFNYRSRESAGDVGGVFNTYHAHCDCKVVCGDEGTVVEGYDPDWYAEVYRDARAAVEDGAYDDWRAAGGREGTGKTYDKYLRDRICAEIETRDSGWARDRSVTCSTVVEDGAKPKLKEVALSETLNSHGFNVQLVKPTGSGRTADATLNGVRWEYKQPTGDASARTIGKNTLDHQFEEAVGQSRNLVLDLTVVDGYQGVEFDSLCEEARGLLRGKWADEFDQVIVVGSDGSMRRYEKA